MKHKLERQMDAEGVSLFLRGLADAFEGKAGDAVPAFDHHLEKLDLKVKAKDGLLTLKLKFEIPSEPGPDGEDVPVEPSAPKREKYKDLKKRMKSDFKQIRNRLGEGAVPDKELMERFLTDADAMTTYPGYGDEYYGEFRDSSARLGEAFAAMDLEGLRRGYEDLKTLRDDCHKDHK
jgi:XXXCH domain-containing protein